MKTLLSCTVISLLVASCCRVEPNRYTYSINDPNTPTVLQTVGGTYVTLPPMRKD